MSWLMKHGAPPEGMWAGKWHLCRKETGNGSYAWFLESRDWREVKGWVMKLGACKRRCRLGRVGAGQGPLDARRRRAESRPRTVGCIWRRLAMGGSHEQGHAVGEEPVDFAWRKAMTFCHARGHALQKLASWVACWNERLGLRLMACSGLTCLVRKWTNNLQKKRPPMGLKLDLKWSGPWAQVITK